MFCAELGEAYSHTHKCTHTIHFQTASQWTDGAVAGCKFNLTKWYSASKSQTHPLKEECVLTVWILSECKAAKEEKGLKRQVGKSMCLGEKRINKETWKESKGKTICCINLPLHSASIESFLHSSFSRKDPGDSNAKPYSILPPETLISY